MFGSVDDPRYFDPNWFTEVDLTVYPPVCYYHWQGKGEVPVQYREKADKSVQTDVKFQCAKSRNLALLAERIRRFEEEKRELAMEDEAQKDQEHKDKKINI